MPTTEDPDEEEKRHDGTEEGIADAAAGFAVTDEEMNKVRQFVAGMDLRVQQQQSDSATTCQKAFPEERANGQIQFIVEWDGRVSWEIPKSDF